MSKTIAAFKCDCYTGQFLEADWLSTRSQKTVHARAVVQLEQEFWIIPEPPAPVPLDKGNEGSGNEIVALFIPTIATNDQPAVGLVFMFASPGEFQ